MVLLKINPIIKSQIIKMIKFTVKNCYSKYKREQLNHSEGKLLAKIKVLIKYAERNSKKIS